MSRKQAGKTVRRSPQAKAKSGDPITDALSACTAAQVQVSKAEELGRKWQEQRREAIRQAFATGASAAEIADAVQVSRAKIYQLLGSARGIKTASNSTAIESAGSQ